MDFIIDYYKELEILDLIVFWGIILVIVLLLIFSIIMLNKNKKLKKLVDENNKYEFNKYEELPIKKDELEQAKISQNKENIKKEIMLNNSQKKDIILPEIPKINEQNNLKYNNSKIIETEKKFVAEEHVMEYNKEFNIIANIKNNSELDFEKQDVSKKNNNPIEIPTIPYQKNVLREMSLNQTSPIGLTIPKKEDNKKKELAKDLEESLNETNIENILSENKESNIKEKIRRESIEQHRLTNLNDDRNINLKYEENKPITQKTISTNNLLNSKTDLINNKNIERQKDDLKINKSIYDERRKEENMTKKIDYEELMTNLENKKELYDSIEKTKSSSKINEINKKEIQSNNQEIKNYLQNKQTQIKELKSMNAEKDNIDPQVKALFNSISIPIEKDNVKKSSEKYLEEVSRKLAEAEGHDEIERTDYEIEQEENAIISYKELMEKKDSIKTIDEEEVVISIEELLKRNNQEDNKLYKLNEEEENDNFIKELKQFRNDL